LSTQSFNIKFVLKSISYYSIRIVVKELKMHVEDFNYR